MLVLRKSLIFLINIIVIMCFYLFINIIISFFLTNIFIIVIIVFFVKYNAYNNLNLFIISIDFFCLKYQLDKSLLDLYIRYLLL